MKVNELMQEYLDAKGAVEGLQKRVATLRLRLFDLIDETGTKDDKGHIWLTEELEDEIMEAKKERRFRSVLDADKFMVFLDETNDKELYELCTETKIVPYEPGIEEAVLTEKLASQELDSMMNSKETFALKVTKRNKESENV